MLELKQRSMLIMAGYNQHRSQWVNNFFYNLWKVLMTFALKRSSERFFFLFDTLTINWTEWNAIQLVIMLIISNHP